MRNSNVTRMAFLFTIASIRVSEILRERYRSILGQRPRLPYKKINQTKCADPRNRDGRERQTMTIQYKAHARKRMAHRSLSEEEINVVLTYGEVHHKAGAVFFYLRRCDIPADEPQAKHWESLAGTAVVLTKDQQIILTTWRNERSGLKNIKRKPAYDARKNMHRNFLHG